MTREAYCLTCGPTEADERGCLRCRCANDRILALSIGSGRTPAEVYEFWSERAAIREHSAGYPREEAERLAVLDTEDWLKERKR